MKRANRFLGRTTVVTGAGSGIGRACAEAFANEGATVVCADVDVDAARKAATAVRGIPMAADVSKAADVDRLAKQIEGEIGRADVLVNAAGVFAVGSVADTDPEQWDRQLAVNLTGTFLCSRGILPMMCRQHSGAIVNISSVAGLVAFPENAAYSSSKGGVVMLTRSIALDFASDGVRANCVCPYVVEGPMMERFLASQANPSAARASIAAATPLGRFASALEIASAVLFLASDEAAYVTGAVLAVDGGYSAR